MSYADLIDKHRRRDILDLIRKGGDAGEVVLLSVLRETGYPKTTSEQLRRDLDQMREMGLLIVGWWEDCVAVASLTDRGMDAAAGRIEVDGIARPVRVG